MYRECRFSVHSSELSADVCRQCRERLDRQWYHQSVPKWPELPLLVHDQRRGRHDGEVGALLPGEVTPRRSRSSSVGWACRDTQQPVLEASGHSFEGQAQSAQPWLAVQRVLLLCWLASACLLHSDGFVKLITILDLDTLSDHSGLSVMNGNTNALAGNCAAVKLSVDL